MNKNILGYLANYNMPRIGENRRYNEIDGLVFAIFSSAPIGPDVRWLKDFFPIDPIGKTMGELSEILIDIDNNDLLSCRFGFSISGDYGNHLEFFTHIAMNNRYKGIKITGFDYSNDGFCQFSAFTFKICAEEYVIAYRGTDNSLEGWYESIRLFHDNVASRQLALNYLQSEIEKNKGVFRLVGYSKGGHLALCAAIMSDTRLKTNIRSIINYDGPGLSTEFIEKYHKSILLLQHKVYRFSPANALISSMLFGHDIMCYEKNKRYIKPYGLKMPPTQHNYFNWLVVEGKFKQAPRSSLSISFQNVSERVHHLYSLKELERISEQIYAQASGIYKDEDNVLSQFDVLTFFFTIALKLMAASRE